MATIEIGSWYSKCSECKKNADPSEFHHTMEKMVGVGCGAKFEAVEYAYSPYETIDFRSDLPVIGFWKGDYEYVRQFGLEDYVEWRLKRGF